MMASFLASGLIPGQLNKIRRWSLDTGPEHSEFLGKFDNFLHDTTYCCLILILRLSWAGCKHLPSVMWTSGNFFQSLQAVTGKGHPARLQPCVVQGFSSYFASQQPSCKLRLIERKQFHAISRANCIYYIHREYKFSFIELWQLHSKSQIYFFLPYECAHVFPFFCSMN